MKRILVAIMAIVLVIGLTGAAFAYFSDTKSQAGNTAHAGTLTLGDTWGTDPITWENMAPGEVTADPYEIDMENTGSLPGDLYMKVTVTTDSAHLISQKMNVNCDDTTPAIDGTALSGLTTYTKIADLNSGDAVALEFYGVLDEDAGNDYQDESCTFTITFALIQDGIDITAHPPA